MRHINELVRKCRSPIQVVTQKGLMSSNFSLEEKDEFLYLFHSVSYAELPVEVLAPRVDFPVTCQERRHVRTTVNLHRNIRAKGSFTLTESERITENFL